MTWLDVVGWEGLYEVSSTGLVRSWNGGRWGRRATPLMLALGLSKDGYQTVHLGKHKLAYVHRLVCTAFNGPCPEGKECAHLDGDPANNASTNLCWKTPIENALDRVTHGTAIYGERHRDAKLTEADVRDIRRRRAAGERPVDLAAEFSVSPQAISGATAGRKWKHLASEA